MRPDVYTARGVAGGTTPPSPHAGTVIELPPWTFTEQDAHRTVEHGPDLIDLVAAAVPDGTPDHDAVRARLAGLRARAQEALAAAAAPDAPPDAAVAALRTVVALRDEAAAAVREAGVLGPDAEGVVSHLAVSDGGVPKRSVEEVEVGWRGVVGDRQAARQHHGRPWQALCLWSTEVIDDFVAQGDPLAPGLAGENITVTGLPWERVRPGVRLRVGTVAVRRVGLRPAVQEERPVVRRPSLRPHAPPARPGEPGLRPGPRAGHHRRRRHRHPPHRSLSGATIITSSRTSSGASRTAPGWLPTARYPNRS